MIIDTFQGAAMRHRDETIAKASQAGTADHIFKPFSLTELTARLAAALRRIALREPFELVTRAIHYDERRVTVGGVEVDLSATEYELLRVLSLEAGWVVTYDALLRKLWSRREAGSTDRAIARALLMGRREAAPHRRSGRLARRRLRPRPGGTIGGAVAGGSLMLACLLVLAQSVAAQSEPRCEHAIALRFANRWICGISIDWVGMMVEAASICPRVCSVLSAGTKPSSASPTRG